MKVLVLGASGAVGTGCLNALAQREDEATVVIAGRDEQRLRKTAAAVQTNFDVAPLDVTDTPAVAAAAARCDAVVNCAGPSQTLSATVGEAVLGAGTAYVDPGGDHALAAQLAPAAAAAPVVLQAGVQPGLTEVLLAELAHRHPGGTDDVVTAWCGGLQPLTPASVREYLASLRDPRGHPGAVLRGGTVRRAGADETHPAPAPYYPDTATVHPHLDAETVAVARHFGIDNLCWLNVLDGIHTKRVMQALAVDGRPPNETGLRDVLAAARLDLFGRRPYFAITARGHSTHGSTTVALTCPDSYRASGAVAAYAARRVTSLPAGVHPLWTADEPLTVLEFVTETVSGAEVSWAENSVTGGSRASMVEDGCL